MRYLLAAVVLAVLVSLLTAFTSVQPGEIAVVRRLGRVLDDRPGPGLYIGLPWGLDRVDRVAVDLVRRVTLGYARSDRDEPDGATPPGQLLTGDHNLVNAQIVIDYKINVDEVVDYVLHADRADTLIARAAEAALTEWVAGRTVDEVLLRGKADLPQWLVAQAQERIAPYRLGVKVQDAGVTSLSPPAEVKDAFENVTRAETGIERRVHEASQEADAKWRAAQAEKFRTERMTAAYVHEQRVMAEAEAHNFEARLAQYRRLRKDNPYYLNALWWDEMGRLYARLRQNGRIDLLDNRLGAGGLDITQMPVLPKKK